MGGSQRRHRLGLLRRPPNSYIVSGSGSAEAALSSHIEFSQVALLHKSIPDGINPNQTDSCHVGHRNGLRTADLAEAVQQGCQSASNTFHLSASNTFHFFSPLMLAFALLESIRIIPCFQDVAVMRDAIQ